MPPTGYLLCGTVCSVYDDDVLIQSTDVSCVSLLVLGESITVVVDDALLEVGDNGLVDCEEFLVVDEFGFGVSHHPGEFGIIRVEGGG